MTIAGELRALAERVPAEGPPAVTLARQRAASAAEVVSAALGTELAGQVAAAVWPDWASPARVRELSALRMPDLYELAEIADRLRRAIAPALDLAHPDPAPSGSRTSPTRSPSSQVNYPLATLPWP